MPNERALVGIRIRAKLSEKRCPYYWWMRDDLITPTMFGPEEKKILKNKLRVLKINSAANFE